MSTVRICTPHFPTPTPFPHFPRTAGLSVFNGDPASGDYRLFIADVAAGDTATLTSWSITLTGTAIPEPGSAALGLLAAAAARR